MFRVFGSSKYLRISSVSPVIKGGAVNSRKNEKRDFYAERRWALFIECATFSALVVLVYLGALILSWVCGGAE